MDSQPSWPHNTANMLYCTLILEYHSNNANIACDASKIIIAVILPVYMQTLQLQKLTIFY